MGQNPAVGASNGRLERKALARLKWLVVRDMVETETASFWYASPEVERGELSPKTIETEVFLFPAAGTAEKAGTFTNTQRLLQYREKAVEAPGDSRSDLWFMYHLGVRLKAKAMADTLPRNQGLRALTWQYSTEGPHEEPNVEEVLQEINGCSVPERVQLSHIQDLKNDGSNRMRGMDLLRVFPEKERNRANDRNPQDSSGTRLGILVAKRLPHHLQPRFGAVPTASRERTQEARLVGRAEEAVDGPRQRGLRQEMPPDVPADIHNGQGITRAWRVAAVYAASRRCGLALRCERTERWPSSGSLRSAGVRDRKSSLSSAEQSCG